MLDDLPGPAVPMVGGLAHQADPDDPVELVGVPIRIDDAAFDEMAHTFAEEFIRDGWTGEQLLDMFRSPMYAGLHVIWEARGEVWVRDLVDATRLRWRRPDPARPASRAEDPR